jgi:predicted regulator of Ras-like GTPase activity (Roadblock/LC7/MglB family)
MTATIHATYPETNLNDSKLSIVMTESAVISPENVKVTISEMLDYILNEIGSIGGIQASVLVSNDGLMMASNNTSSGVDDDIIGALVAMLIRSAAHVSKELLKEGLDYLLLHTARGEILIMKAGSNAIFTLLTDSSENIGLIIIEMKKACKKVENILE